MAPRRPLRNPPPVSSSDEVDDEESSSDEEEIVEKLEEEKELEEEDEEEEEEETLPSPPVHKSVKPAPELLTTPISKKRAAAETPTSAQTSRKKAKGTAPSAEDEKRVGFQRIWSDEDVIAILEGLVAFKEDKGADDFYDYIKDAIHVSVSKGQMGDKLRGLKKKYLNNAKRGKDGKDPVFPKPHDLKTFQLSKLIWGDAPAPAPAPAATPKPKVSVPESSNNKTVLQLEWPHDIPNANADGFWTRYPSLHQSIDLIPLELRSLSKEGMPSVSPSKVKEMDDQWHKWNINKFNLIMKKSQLFLDVSRAMGFGEGN